MYPVFTLAPLSCIITRNETYSQSVYNPRDRLSVSAWDHGLHPGFTDGPLDQADRSGNIARRTFG